MRSIVEFLKSMNAEAEAERRPTAERPLGSGRTAERSLRNGKPAEQPLRNGKPAEQPLRNGKVVALSEHRRATSYPPAEGPDDSDPGPSAA